MSVTPSLSAGLAQLEALANFIDEGSSNATFTVYSGTKPANTTSAADSSNALCALTFEKPCLLAVNTANITLKPTANASVTKSGTATWARLYNGNGVVVADFVVGTDVTLTSNDLVAGGVLQMSSITLTPITG